MNYISCLGILWQLRGAGPHPHLLTDWHKAKPEIGAGALQSGGWWSRQRHHFAIIKITLLNDRQSATEEMLKLWEILTWCSLLFWSASGWNSYFLITWRWNWEKGCVWMQWGWSFGSLAAQFSYRKSSFQWKGKREEFQNKSDLKLLIWNHFHW